MHGHTAGAMLNLQSRLIVDYAVLAMDGPRRPMSGGGLSEQAAPTDLQLGDALSRPAAAPCLRCPTAFSGTLHAGLNPYLLPRVSLGRRERHLPGRIFLLRTANSRPTDRQRQIAH